MCLPPLEAHQPPVSRRRRRPLPCLLYALATACYTPQRGASEADMALAEHATQDGALVFESYCGECHGPRGQGTAGRPPIVGSAALEAYATALDLHTYVAAHMPKLGKSELAEPDYWAVVGFLAAANGARLPDEGLGEANAAQLKLHDR